MPSFCTNDGWLNWANQQAENKMNVLESNLRPIHLLPNPHPTRCIMHYTPTVSYNILYFKLSCTKNDNDVPQISHTLQIIQKTSQYKLCAEP